jgi:hypothetical protein
MTAARTAVVVTLAAALAVGDPSNATTLPSAHGIAAPHVSPTLRVPPIPKSLKALFRKKPPLRARPIPIRGTRPAVAAATLSHHVINLRFAQYTSEARTALVKIYRRGRYENVSVYAFCWAIERLADYYPSTAYHYPNASWRKIFFDFIFRYIRDAYVPRAIKVVESWTDVWDMAQINPRLAVFYARACYG